jgi:uncharacterized cupredoxin-like copper-binding protein
MKPGQGGSHRVQVVLGIVAALILTGLSVLVVGTLRGGVNPGGYGFPAGSSCTAPTLSGTLVNVALTDMGGPMMGQGNGMMYGGTMRLSADRTTVPQGTVSFLVTNRGSIDHEMTILPLPDSQTVGSRPIGGDAKIDEAGSFGHAATSCGEGEGQGVVPGASSWVTITLAPGRYELVCNLSGHYAAGMYTQLTVTK